MHMSYCLYLLIVCGLAAGAAQSGSNGCILPPYPAHGTYTVHDRPEAVPGQTYGLAILKVTCDPGYRVIGNNATYCFSNNDWQHPMPRCTRFCRLTPDPSVKYFCKVTGDGILGGTRLCHELEPHGTVVVPICNYPVYYSSKVLLNMHCVDGAWDHVATCQPDCGKTPRKGQEIIITGKGTKVAHGDLPWHAAIYDKSYTPFMQVCGGSLVSTKVVISAAHCFWNDGQHPASRYAVALGKIYRPWNDSMDLGAHKSDVKEIKMPARFFGEVAHYQDDIALVIMSTPVVYNTYIRPVCLDLDDEFDRNQLQSSSSGRLEERMSDVCNQLREWFAANGLIMNVTKSNVVLFKTRNHVETSHVQSPLPLCSYRLGLTSADGVESPVLLTAELPYVDVRKCLDNLDFEFWSYVTSDKICAGSTDGATVCKGDGGGGLVFPNEDRGTRRYFLRGVVSTAPISGHNCNANTFTTFTHILPHATFIRDHGLGIVSVRDGSDSGLNPSLLRAVELFDQTLRKKKLQLQTGLIQSLNPSLLQAVEPFDQTLRKEKLQLQTDLI
ncbi:modular serine protease-like [Choristoneura fumiferana]|uniref:modular serine protease-like n=1 Tax=Choristoneura fumiferana TaxID=7141 RepID=UPI003D156428